MTKDVLDERELMRAHVRALFTHDARARLLSVNEPGGGPPAPRMFLGRTRAGNVWRFRADLPESLVEELGALCADEPADAGQRAAPRHAEAYVRLLGTHAHVRAAESGPAYCFEGYPEPARPLVVVTQANAELLSGGFEKLVDELKDWQPFLALLDGGRAASVCRSVRITREAHEAGVETLHDFRGRGYAADVTAGWARHVRAAGATPLYSTSWENVASQAVAHKLRLARYGADFHLD